MPRSEIARSYGSSIFDLSGTLHTVFHIVDAPTYNPTNTARSFPFLHILSTYISCLSDDSPPDKCEAVPYCGLNLHFLMISDAEQLFMSACCLCVCFGKIFSSSAHFLILLEITTFLCSLFVLNLLIPTHNPLYPTLFFTLIILITFQHTLKVLIYCVQFLFTISP